MPQQTRERSAAGASGLQQFPSTVPGPAALFGWLTPVLVAVAFLAFAAGAGLPVSSAVRALVAVVLTQLLPGMLLWRLLRPRHGWWLEDVSMGLAFGIVLGVGVQTVAGAGRLPWLSWAAPLAVVSALLAVPAARRRIASARTTALPWWWAPATCAVAVTALQQLHDFHRQAPLTWASGFRQVHMDMYLHTALSAQLAHRGPTRFPWVQSEELGYHWFSHAWVAHVSQASGAELDEVLLRFMPALMPLVVVLSVAAAAVRLTGHAWTGPIAALLTLAGGDLNLFGVPGQALGIAPLSPSLSLSVPVLVAMVVLMGLRWRREVSKAALLPLAALAFVAAGTKGSTLPLVVAGLALAAAAMVVFDRSRLRGVLVDLSLILGCLLAAFVLVFHGSDAGLTLDPSGAAAVSATRSELQRPDSWAGDVFVAALTFATIVARGCGVVLALAGRSGRRDPLTWTLAGGGIAGAVAPLLFTHPGNSQYYFTRSAAPLLALGSVVGLALVADRLGPVAHRVLLVGAVAGPLVAMGPAWLLGRSPPRAEVADTLWLLGVAAAALALAAALAVAVAHRGRSGVPPRGRPGDLTGIACAGATAAVLAAGCTVVVHKQATWERAKVTPVAAGAPLAHSRDQIDAARWIRDHSGRDDLVMTNRHCTTPVSPVRGCDSRRFVVAAFSERQVLLEGWTATPRATRIVPSGRGSITVAYWNPELLALNDGFIARPDATAARRLVDLGVRWVYVDHTRPYAATLEPYAALRLRTAGVDVYELLRP